ncbi:S1C family serine protease [Thermus thermamylovorans]|uniref:Serine protease n=1 Tax=Thermus thermamylovorans TaxID=2509362 RepID=A0A4Q9B6K0_9DEIN|nr:S1C family serine protease [Thermus thermamylovorans]TBH20703.1 serine protease [Thermus thermamylovorans]
MRWGLLLLLPLLALGQRLVSPEEVARSQAIARALPAVVRVQGTSLAPGEGEVVGTGFFVSPFRVVTNYHVVRDLADLTVRLADGRTFPAERFAVDPGIDIALLTVRGAQAPGVLAFSRTPTRSLVLGMGVVLVGFPFGQGPLASYGILSGIGPLEVPTPDPSVGAEVGEYLFTDAPLTVGNSGSPLMSLQGEVIGVVADVIGGPSGLGGIGVAVPGELVAQSVQDLERFGIPQRGWLGASLISLDELPPVLLRAVGLTTAQGAMVDRVEPGGPAARAGLRGAQRDAQGRLLVLGDVILAVDGQPVQGKAEVVRLIARYRPGDRVRLTLWREGRRLEVTLTMVARPRR